MNRLRRRDFLAGTAGGLVGVAAGRYLSTFERIAPPPVPPWRGLPEWDYKGWEDLYHKEWTWDAVGLATHSVGCVAGCAWKVYTKGNVPLREEQSSRYPVLPGIPSNSPRGCQKGAVYTQWMLQPDFLKYPLKRVGERGERKWKRITWDEALDEIAEKMMEVALKDGPGHLYFPNRVFSFLSKAASIRLANLLGGIKPDVSAFVGDLYPGTRTVRGFGRTVSTFDDWFTSDLILLWHKNIVATRIPDAHFALEARYNGGRVVTISVDYNPTAIHSDLFVPVKMGSDSWFAASLVYVLLKNGWFKSEYLKEQTDFPLLVRADTGKFLRESDLRPQGRTNAFYVWDERTSRAVEAPGTQGSNDKTLELGDVRPALEGTFRVDNIPVTTIFELVKKELLDPKYAPENTQRASNVHPSVVYRLAEWIRDSKALRIISGYNSQKHFDGFMTERFKVLLTALSGSHGTTGSVDTTYEGWRMGPGALDTAELRNKPGRGVGGVLAEWVWGETRARAKNYYDQRELKDKLGFDVDDMERMRLEAQDKGWMPRWQDIKSPKVTYNVSCNYFRHAVGSNDFREHFLKKVELFVVVDVRMCSAATWADIVLPAATDYERWDARETSVTRFIHLFGQPVKPMFERKSDWQISVELCRKIQEKARARGIGSIEDAELSRPGANVTVDLHTLYDDFTLNGKIARDEDALRYLCENAPALGKGSYEKLLEYGFFALGSAAAGFGPIPSDKPYRPFTPQGIGKQPYPTLTGRLQFYIDQDWYLNLNAALPKPQYPGGGTLGPKKYPFNMDYPHTRWGIHSSFRTEKWMMRLQRGDPYVYLNPKVMERKGVKDGDWVRVFNDHGEFYMMAKPGPTLPEYIVFNEHGWEQYQFPKSSKFSGQTHYNDVNADLINPLELVGGYGHLSFVSGDFNPNRIYYETTVDVERVSEADMQKLGIYS